MVEGSRYEDGRYIRDNPSWHAEDSAWKARVVADIIHERRLYPASLCDVGCGSGGVVAALSEEFSRATCVGYDISRDAVDAARTLHPAADVRHGDILASGAVWDIVLLLDVIEHLEDCYSFLRSIGTIARRVVLHIPLEMTVQAVLRMQPLISARRSVGHLHYFSRETALLLLEECNYEIEYERFTRSGVDAPSLRRRQLVAGIPRALAFRAHPAMASRTLGGFSLAVVAKPIA